MAQLITNLSRVASLAGSPLPETDDHSHNPDLDVKMEEAAEDEEDDVKEFRPWHSSIGSVISKASQARASGLKQFAKSKWMNPS